MSKKPKRAAIWIAIFAIVIAVFLCFAQEQSQPAPTEEADRIIVEKSSHTLSLYKQTRLLKTYKVALGRGGLGPKTRAGDNKVPEGIYPIVGRNAHSAFHRALRVGYPTAEQLQEAQGADLGGDIMVHGIRNGLGWLGSLQHRVDWTKGCIAVTDDEIEEIYRAVPDGTPIEIRP